MISWRGFGRCVSVPVVAVLAGLFVAGCRQDWDKSKPETFVFARGADASLLDPADVTDGESINSLAHVYEALLAFAPGSVEVVPGLATSWEVSEDGLTYTFQLREGVTFHDGTAFNAEAVLFSFQRQMDSEHPAHFPDAGFAYWNSLYTDIVAVEAVDAMTVVIRLAEPNVTKLQSLASFPVYIMSPAAFEAMGDGIKRHPVGTGPYQFASWQADEAIIYERFEDYWGEPGQFDRLILRPIRENQVRLLELTQGTVHALDGLDPAEIASLQDDERFTIHQRPGLNVGYVAISHFAEHLRDPEVRQAIAMAIDREKLVQLALDGYGYVADYPMPPGFLGEPEGDAPIRFDPEAAREILARHPEVLESTIRIAGFANPRPYYPNPSRVGSLVRADLEAVGLTVEVISRDWGSHLHTVQHGDFDLGLLGWSADYGDPDNFLVTFFHSDSATMGSANNIAFYEDAEMDALLDAGRRTADVATRQVIYENALSIWARDMPLIPLVHSMQIAVTRREVTGYVLHPVSTHFLGPVGWNETAE